MATLRFRMRRTQPSPPFSYEPTPYCDRLTLAEAFSVDDETRANAEDRRAERLRVVEAATSSLQAPSLR